MRKILASAGAIGLFSIASIAFAQTTLPEGVTEEQMSAAFKDLSAVYGAPIVRLDQAKAICNEEQYIVDCAQIGKKHDLFSDERTKQVDTLLTEFKGEAVEKLKQCEDVACLVEVATSIARRLNSGNPAVARAVELTPAKVEEKRTIVETAKSLGVDIEACRTMDPDTASVELLRSCARLAKDVNVQKYIPQETKDRTEGTDAAIALKEGLASGQVACGDNTLNGCGNFCLAPSAEARAKGVVAIPPVCRQIASRFFGDNGVRELEKAYTAVQDTFNTLTERTQSVVFTTADGRALTDPPAIGKYLEEAGSRGDVEAVTRGMDFLVARGFVTSEDRDFALTMVGKIKERGSVDFDVCRADPSRCADVVSEKDRGQFSVMNDIEKIMRSEMAKRGVADPSRCSSDAAAGASCLEAARAALPQIERLAATSPQAQAIVSDIRQKIRFGEAGFEARSRVEERLTQTGDFSIGDRHFGSFTEIEAFCRTNSQQCLSETAREGIFSKDIAAEKYQYVIETNYSLHPEDVQNETRPNTFNREEALRQYKQWLENPQGPPPMPPGMDTRPYSRYTRPSVDPRNCQFAMVMPTPCKAGEYRQESINELGCPAYGSCIPFSTRTEPPRVDGPRMCPAMPTVESCPVGSVKVAAFSSPECGTYYTCTQGSDDPNRISTGCERYGSGWRSVDSSGNCFNSAMTEYRTSNGTFYTCASFPAYGCSSTYTPPPSPPGGQKEQVWNSGGLRSWIRSDASADRIASLKSACANVPSQANVWLPGAGTQSNADFGMPDPAKCAKAATCSSTQYFDGSACVTNTTPQPCGSNEYWNGSNCVPSSTASSTTGWNAESAKQGCASAGGTWDITANYCKMPGSSCSTGMYWNGTSCVNSSASTCGSQVSQSSCVANSACNWNTSGNYCTSNTTTTACPSDQYWNGTSCVSNTTTVTGSCSSELIGLLGSGCHSMGGGWFNGEMTKYVVSGSQTVRSCSVEYLSGCTTGTNTQTQTCPSGQYWNGSACTTSTTQTDTTTAQQGCTQAGGTWDSAANYCKMPSSSCSSGQYWNGSACVTSTTSTSCPSGQYWNGSACATTATTDTAPSSSTSCPSGQYWNGSACQSSESTYTAPSSGSYTPPPSGSYTPPPSGSAPISYLFCPSGHEWNGAYCTLTPRSDFERYTAGAWFALRSLLGL